MTYLKDCEQYNVDENKWKALPSLNEARDYNGSIYINKTKTIYCFGGCSEFMVKYNGKTRINRTRKQCLEASKY